jgi:hypothetical protein
MWAERTNRVVAVIQRGDPGHVKPFGGGPDRGVDRAETKICVGVDEVGRLTQMGRFQGAEPTMALPEG